jgi:streptogrisin C
LTAAPAKVALAQVPGKPAQAPGARPDPVPVGPVIEGPDEALARDAGEYARLEGVTLDEAVRRLRAQEESVAVTERLRRIFEGRLAGISIDHRPDYRIVVLLTGDQPIAGERIRAGGIDVPIVFRTGAAATGDEIVAAIEAHQAEIRSMLVHPPGLGADPRTGELVVMTYAADAESFGPGMLKARLEALTGVPVRIRELDHKDSDFAVAGGSRVEGFVDGRRYACTSGFVVTDGTRDAIVTAAHCPDTLTYLDPEGGERALSFAGQWGWSYQDVQVNLAEGVLEPLFYADSAKRLARPVTSWRNRAATRAGDFVCHRGEGTGYSCAEVELVDFAPSGDLCGGPCRPTWVTVAGPECRGGDSGAPVFSGTIAFGIVKGGSHRADGGCAFYYYISTDYLPQGWSLRHR